MTGWCVASIRNGCGNIVVGLSFFHIASHQSTLIVACLCGVHKYAVAARPVYADDAMARRCLIIVLLRVAVVQK